MRLIKPYYEIESEIDGEKILKHIEKAARTCYKSEHLMGDFEKTKKFVQGVLSRGHESTIEHYSVSVRFIIDRGVSHELVRMRLCSFSQESSRYCNYSDDKFGNDITYIIPPWIKLENGKYTFGSEICIKSETTGSLIDIKVGDEIYEWLCALATSENIYFNLIGKFNWKPEQARSVLPNALKTEIVTTANLREWRHIFKLRAAGTTGKPHPQMSEVMIPLLKEFQEKIPVLFDDIIVKED